MEIILDDLDNNEIQADLGKVQKKRGRKAGQKIIKEAANKNITISLTMKQYEEVSDYCNLQGLGVSTFIRNLLLKEKVIKPAKR